MKSTTIFSLPMSHKITVFVLALLSSLAAGAQVLLPQPKVFTPAKGAFAISEVLDGDSRIVTRLRPMAHREEYTLIVRRDSIIVEGADSAGLLHARQTLVLLADKGRIGCCTVHDWPTLGWRSAMIDVSRHFFPIDFLKKQVDWLSSFKFNRLHLHLTDAAGWRIQVDSWPRLTSETAWRTQSDWQRWWTEGDRRYCHAADSGAYGGFYTKAELRSLVDYAQRRGVTIEPEIEMPGHSEEVQAAYPELCCHSGIDSLDRVFAHSGDLCPGNELTYKFIEDVLTEVMDVFPSAYIHIGGDEANMTAWPQCLRCRALMQRLGTTDTHRLQTHLVNRAVKFLRAHGRKAVAWDEVVGDSLSPDVTVQVWRKGDAPRRAAEKGCGVVLSPAQFCYLNNNQDAPGTPGGDNGTSYLPLVKVNTFKPRQILNDSVHLKGIEGCLWTEYVETHEEVESMLWPRLLSLAETAWNGAPDDHFDRFHRKAAFWTARMRAEGLNAFDLSHEVGERKESLSPVRHKAIGATVTYNRPYSSYYPAAGAATLTDGRRGGWYFDDHRWQGFCGPDALDFTVDLGKVKPVRSVSLTFLQAADAWIYLPAGFRISISTDGVRFSTLYETREARNPATKLLLTPYGWQGKTRARYIRVEATPEKDGEWLFTDEVVVK